jgi:hypothetical protein
MIPNESTMTLLRLEIKNFIDISKNREQNILIVDDLAKKHLKFHFMSGNKSNLIKIHRCFEKICYAPDGLEQLN